MDDHVPVLLTEVLEGLALKPEGVYVDMTFGRGGHAKAILTQLTTGHLYAFDRDRAAVDAGTPLIATYPGKLTLIHNNFIHVKQELDTRGIAQADGILMDLGVSSPQFDEGERGFSYKEDAALDMRMDQTDSLTAETIVNSYDLKHLTAIFREYGDEPQAYEIAKAIVKAREDAPITTTGALVALIKASKPQRELKKKGHPAKQAFQALRIAVNDELGNLAKGLSAACGLLKSDGRLAVITFHSGEDRLVKNYFRDLTTVVGTRQGPAAIRQPEPPAYALYNRQVILPSPVEIAANHRASSAKLRIIIRK